LDGERVTRQATQGKLADTVHMPSLIDIVLATYNGAAYLPAQLDSLFAQTCQDFRLLVRDDGSSDGTPGVLADYATRYPGRMVMVPNDGGRLKAAGSFATLLERAEAPYVMCCDQDDVWVPDKVALTLAAMHDLEQRHGTAAPLLVDTDLMVVDERLAVLAESFWRFSRIHPERITRLSRLLMQNFVTGCTMMVNRPLLALALPIPAGAMMHDWWLALVAIRFGHARPIAKATVLYRQHGRNEVGADRWSFWEGIRNLLLHRDRRRKAIADQAKLFALVAAQATAFVARFGQRLTPAEHEMIRGFCALGGQGFFGRRHLMLKHDFLLSDRWQTFMMLVR
jgi:glycosyltransferase involved in cell wall biosynthesis